MDAHFKVELRGGRVEVLSVSGDIMAGDEVRFVFSDGRRIAYDSKDVAEKIADGIALALDSEVGRFSATLHFFDYDNEASRTRLADLFLKWRKNEKNNPAIPASAETDDDAFRVDFDALDAVETWKKQGLGISPEDAAKMVNEGLLKNSFESDEFFMSLDTKEAEEMRCYMGHAKMPDDEPVGYSVSIDEDAFIAWATERFGEDFTSKLDR